MIRLPDAETLLVRREVSTDGRGRAFIEDEPASVRTLLTSARNSRPFAASRTALVAVASTRSVPSSAARAA